MKKKIEDLTDEEVLDILGDDKCKYCPYESIETKDGGIRECPKTIKCYGGDAVYPLCLDFGADEVYKAIIDNFKDGVDLDQEIEVKEYE